LCKRGVFIMSEDLQEIALSPAMFKKAIEEQEIKVTVISRVEGKKSLMMMRLQLYILHIDLCVGVHSVTFRLER